MSDLLTEGAAAKPDGGNRSVSVICAPPNGRNPGMTSVDLAFEEIAREAGVREATYWRLWDQSEWSTPPGGSSRRPDGTFLDEDSGLTYHPLRGRLDEALSSDCVVFWGDFLHMAVYQRQNVDVLTRRTGLFDSAEEAEDVVARHLLLRGQPRSTFSKVISYGSTLSFNSASDYAGRYGQDLKRFLSSAHRVWLRDPYSALVAAAARGDRDEVCKGVDAAFLLPDTARPAGENRLGVFFGRSDIDPESVARLGRAITQRLEIRPTWIPWGEQPAFWPIRDRRRLRLAWPGLEHEVIAPSPAERMSTYRSAARGGAASHPGLSTRELVREIARCRLVLTDTYHLAVTAWRLGVPAVCVIDHPGGAWNVNSGEAGSNRDKRVDLYSQLDAVNFLVDSAALGSSAGARGAVDRIAAQLSDPGVLDVPAQRLSALVGQSRSLLVGSLRGLLG